MASIKRAFASFAIVTLGALSLATPAFATTSLPSHPISVNRASIAHDSGTTTYSCPSGGTLSGTSCVTTTTTAATATTGTTTYSSTCTTSSSYAATATSTYNAEAMTVSQTQEQNCQYPTGNIGGTWYCGAYITTYSCPSGGSLSGSTCTTSSSYAAAWNSGGGYYSCPSGGSLSGSTCTTSSSYAATATTGGTTYSCPSGGTLSGTQCTTSSSYAATPTTGTTTYSCPSGGSLSGSTCTTTSSYAATATTTSPGGTTTTYMATATATSSVSQAAAQTSANAEVTAYDTTSTTTYTATAIATDGTVFTATSSVSQAAAQTAANAEVTVYDTTNATTVTIVPTAANVPRSVPLVATVVVTNAPSNAGGTIVATLMGPVSTSSAACRAAAPSRFASAGKKSYTAVAVGSGSYSIAAAAPSRPGCYAWSATVTYAGGVKASLAASGKSSLFVVATHLAANRVSIPTSGVLARTVAVATRTREINQLATATTVAVWNAKALSAKTGTTVIAGHVSSPGSAAGVLSRATQLKAGSLVYATTSTGKVTTWTVTKIQTVSSIPASLFAGGGTHRLVLLTCVGTYNPTLGHYTTYVIISARAS